MRKLTSLCCTTAAALVAASFGIGLRADDNPKAKADASGIDIESLVAKAKAGGDVSHAPEKKYRDFAEVTKGAEKIDGGLFTLHKKDDHLYAEIKPFQFDQPLLAPIVISKGMASAGNPLNFGDEWVIAFHRVGDRVQVIRRNIHYKAPAGTPLERAVKQNYTDSILMAVPIVSLNPAGGMSVVVDLSDIFFTDFAQLGLGFLDRSRTNWHKVKAYPNNLELQVEATFGGGGRGGAGDDGVIDRRGNTVVVHYSLVKLPDGGYRPRAADDRVGHFLNATKDFGNSDQTTNFVRMVNRWRLEKADGKAKLSPPKRRIIWWVENTVPDEYRPFVEAGILEWNKAFEKIGFRNAIEVRWQTDKDEFDPEDINYCTFKWITTNSTYAMSCLRSNPMTGEMIDGDVIFDAGFIKSFRREYALLSAPAPSAFGAPAARKPIALAEIISPIMAAKAGYGLPAQTKIGGDGIEAFPANWTDEHIALRQRLANHLQGGCQFASGMRYQMALAALALADEGKAEPGQALSEEFLGQAIKMIVMHEVGHSLGLRHNFKSSTMLSADQLNDTNITRQKGLVGSVMDYSGTNIAPKGQKQGDFFTTTLGPYDYWSIEYAYKPIDGNEEAELQKIAARAPEPDLVFATDEDMMSNNDPQVNTWDLGADPTTFARQRMALAADLLKNLDAKAVKNGDSWARNRDAFDVLFAQYGDGAYLIAENIAGQSVNRDHKGDKNGRDPIVPTPGAKQRESLKLLVDQILSDHAFQFSPALLRRLGTEKWYHWGSDGMMVPADAAILERALSVQRIALGHCLSSDTLTRIQNQELQADANSNPLKLSEVFRAISDGVWSDLDGASDKKPVALSTLRRNLQREHLKRLSTMVLGEPGGGAAGSPYMIIIVGGRGGVPADARALARLHLKEIDAKITKALRDAPTSDDLTKAHLEESKHRIAKILDAPLNAIEP